MKVADIKLPDGVEAKTDGETIVLSISAPQEVEIPEAPAAEEEAPAEEAKEEEKAEEAAE